MREQNRTWRGLGAAGLLGVCALVPIAARADHKVYSPIVQKGELEFETRHHWTMDNRSDQDGEGAHLFELGYGVTDWWSTAIFGTLADEPGRGTRYGETAWENIFQLTPQGRYGLDAGFYVEYAHAARGGVADDIETKLLLEKETGPLVHTANFIFEKQIGEHRESGTEFGYAWRTRWAWKHEFQPAIELYGSFGPIRDFQPRRQQEHQAGPVFLGGFGPFSYELGWLFGLTKGTPHNTIKLTMEYEFIL